MTTTEETTCLEPWATRIEVDLPIGSMWGRAHRDVEPIAVVVAHDGEVAVVRSLQPGFERSYSSVTEAEFEGWWRQISMVRFDPTGAFPWRIR